MRVKEDQDIFFKVQQMFKRKQMGRPIAYNQAPLHTLEKGLGVQRWPGARVKRSMTKLFFVDS